MIDISSGQFVQRASKPCVPGTENVISITSGENKFVSPLLIFRAAVQGIKPSWKSAGYVWRVFNINSTLVKVSEEKRNLEIGDSLILFPEINPYSLRVIPHDWIPGITITVWEFVPNS